MPCHGVASRLVLVCVRQGYAFYRKRAGVFPADAWSAGVSVRHLFGTWRGFTPVACVCVAGPDCCRVGWQLTSYGSLGLDMAWAPHTPFANVPLTVGVGAVTDKVIVVNGHPAVRRLSCAPLSCVCVL